ncbi:ABC transporter substrate-binding protein [Frondihabitans peucedani]|uniref:ABC transporter substrate-binding protein n=1 Tax=Frondihabitans peucedani TaxID=598626 RepID=A0ABP8E1E5_9MICO
MDIATEKLVRVGTDYKPHADLAMSWKASADGLSWDFAIRDGVKFNTGSTMTADDVVATIDRVIAPNSVSAGAGAFAGILKSVKVGAPGHVVFTLDKPFSDFPYLLAGSNTQILPADYKTGTWQAHPVGTGPFVITNFAAGQSITFKKNPTYWNKGAIHLAGVKVNEYKDQQARVLGFQSGQEDALIGETIPASFTSALDPSKYVVRTQPEAGFSAFVLRVDEKPFNDKKVRQALAWALDRKAIKNVVYGGNADLGNDTVYGPTDPVRPNVLKQRDASPDKVSSLLGSKKVAFTITTSSTDETQALQIQQQLKKYKNFSVKVNVLTADQYFAAGANSPWLSAQATITYWSSRPSPSQYNDFLYRTGAIWNASHYSNAKLDTLSSAYDSATTSTERQKLVNQIAKIEWDDAPVIITAFGHRREFLDKNVHLPRFAVDVDYTGAWMSPKS